MEAKQPKAWWRRLLARLGTAMVVAGLGCVALIFVGIGSDTVGSIPIRSEGAPPQEVQGPADKTLYLTIPELGLQRCS